MDSFFQCLVRLGNRLTTYSADLWRFQQRSRHGCEPGLFGFMVTPRPRTIQRRDVAFLAVNEMSVNSGGALISDRKLLDAVVFAHGLYDLGMLQAHRHGALPSRRVQRFSRLRGMGEVGFLRSTCERFISAFICDSSTSTFRQCNDL